MEISLNISLKIHFFIHTNAFLENHDAMSDYQGE